MHAEITEIWTCKHYRWLQEWFGTEWQRTSRVTNGDTAMWLDFILRMCRHLQLYCVPIFVCVTTFSVTCK